MAGREKTALGIARARFVDGLPGRSRELRAALEQIGSSEDMERLREEIRRRLHALYASAQVFREQTLADAIKRGIDNLDRAREARRVLNADDRSALEKLADSLPTLASKELGTPSLGWRSEDEETGQGQGQGQGQGERPSAPAFAAASRQRTISSHFLQPEPEASEPTAETEGVAPQQGAAPEREAESVAEARPESPLPPEPVTGATLEGPLPPIPESEAAPDDQPPVKAENGTAQVSPLLPETEPAELLPSLPPADRQLSRQEAASVLVVDEVESQAEVRLVLPEELYEVLGSSEAEEALLVARASSPDIVLVGESLVPRGGAELVKRLRADPLTEAVPIVLLRGTGEEPGEGSGEIEADARLDRPLETEALIRIIAELVESAPVQGSALEGVEEVSVEELEQLVAREIRRGLSGSLSSGKEHRVSLGDGNEILAAVWSAVSRLRVFLSQRSGGGVRFRDVPGRGGPAMLALVEEDGTEEAEPQRFDLIGRRILVADDDPAVLWFFSGLLNEAGATVVEAEDGRQALSEARRHRPDLVISDILMPEIDGFELCRELKQDLALGEVPVILISWKEDFLQRMRELQSGATAYLTKESGSARILGRVHDALRPLRRLEAGLRTGGVVRGRVEGIGVFALLQTVSRERPDSRITVRDARSLFEIDLRKGNLVALTQTASDGSFVRGRAALERVLASGAARFTVMDADEPMRDLFGEPLATLLGKSANRLGALLDALSDSRLLQVELVEFDESMLEPVLGGSPGADRELVQALQQGASPRRLLLEQQVAPRRLCSLLDDLARRGAVVAVVGAEGQDRVAEALRRREQAPDTLFSSAPDAGERSSEPASRPTEPMTRPAGVRGWIPEPDKRARTRDRAPEEDGVRFALEEEQREFRLLSDPPPLPPRASRTASLVARARVTRPDRGAPVRAVTAGAGAEKGAESGAEPGEEQPAQRPAAAPAKSGSDNGRLRPAATDGRAAPGDRDARGKPGGAGLLLGVALLMVFGYAGWKLVGRREPTAAESRWPALPASGVVEKEPPAIQARPEATGAEEAADDDGSGEPDEGQEAAERETGEGETRGEPANESDPSWGSTLPFIDKSRGVEVNEEQGLLVIEAENDGERYRVQVDGRDRGSLPLGVALAPGRHELRFRRGGVSSYRFLVVEKGRTRVVQAP